MEVIVLKLLHCLLPAFLPSLFIPCLDSRAFASIRG